MLICRTLFWEHIHFFTNLKFVWENSIFHLFTNVARFSKKNSYLQGLDKDWISRWLGREHEENVARTREMLWLAFLPSISRSTEQLFIVYIKYGLADVTLLWTLKIIGSTAIILHKETKTISNSSLNSHVIGTPSK